MAIAAIQPCPIIPDYKEPTASTLPIIAQTPDASFCIDGWDFIEQAKAVGRSTIRCHIFHIAHHSDIELAIRKAAIRVMPQGGKCSYAELVRNTHRLYQALQNTSDDLVLFSHGGDRRGVGFTDSKENNIRVVLADRLGKSPTTINKYLQHGDGLNDAAMEELVDAGAPKQFFEAVQTQKEDRDSRITSRGKGRSGHCGGHLQSGVCLVERIPTACSAKNYTARKSAAASSKATHCCTRPLPKAKPASHSKQRSPSGAFWYERQSCSQTPTPTNQETVAAELKRIGEALIEIADGQERPTPQQVETIRRLILELSTLLQRLVTSLRTRRRWKWRDGLMGALIYFCAGADANNLPVVAN